MEISSSIDDQLKKPDDATHATPLGGDSTTHETPPGGDSSTHETPLGGDNSIEQTQQGDPTASVSIFRFPSNLIGIMNDTAHLPQLVSIGPYHQGEGHLLEFEKHKLYYHQRHLSSIENSIHHPRIPEDKEKRAREFYSGMPAMSSKDFTEMMKLDSCFVIQFLIGLDSGVDEKPEKFKENDPIYTMPWLIPILITDLLKLENQIPFFILEWLWPLERTDPLVVVAVKVFNMLFQMPWDSNLKVRLRTYEPKHLLDLFHLCFSPSNQSTTKSSKPHVPSLQSIPCAGKLSSSGMKFSSKKVFSFLDIELRGLALKIPSIIINEWTESIILNCVAFEQQRDQSTYFSTYVLFMNSLISEPKDVALLCSNKIITSSMNDKFVVNFFNKLAQKINFNIRDCYLSEEFSQLKAFYTGFVPTMRRRYFSSSLTSIVTFYAPILLILTVGQLILQFLQYRQPSKH